MGKRKRRSELGSGVELELAQSVKKKKSAKLAQRPEASASEESSFLRRGQPSRLLLTQDGAFTDTSAHELAVQTFYSQEDEYSALHSQYFLTNDYGRLQMEMRGDIKACAVQS